MKKGKENYIRIIYSALATAVCLAVVFSLQAAFAVWTPPVSVPPAGNEPAFLNIGLSSQYKKGALTMNGLFATDNGTHLALLGGNVGIGTTTPNEKFVLDGGNFLQTAGNPKHMGAIFDDTTTLLKNAREISISGTYAYIVSNGEDGVEILDISDPKNPKHVSSINKTSCEAQAGAGNCALNKPWGIQVVGKYAYVVNEGVYDSGIGRWLYSGMEILDISNPSGPKHVSAIFDVACDAANGGSTPPNGCALESVSNIYISGKYAYLTGVGGWNGLEIIDISDPANPKHVKALYNMAAEDVFVQGTYAYIAAKWNGIVIVDISNPYNPIKVGQLTDATCESINGSNACALLSVLNIYVSGKYAFLTSSSDGGGESGLEIVDISDPYTPKHVSALFDSTCEAQGLGSCALGNTKSLYISGRYAYIADFGDGGVEVLDISNPSSPKHAGAIFNSSCDSANPPNGCALGWSKFIYVLGKYAYVTSYWEYGLEVLDISGIDSPAANIGNISSSNITVSENMDIGNNLYVRTGINVGLGGIKSDGPITASDLETAGGIIKISPQSAVPATCNSNSTGRIFYYYKTSPAWDEPCYCNGTSWTQFDGGGVCN
jgi:hypothetical protein